MKCFFSVTGYFFRYHVDAQTVLYTEKVFQHLSAQKIFLVASSNALTCHWVTDIIIRPVFRYRSREINVACLLISTGTRDACCKGILSKKLFLKTLQKLRIFSWNQFWLRYKVSCICVSFENLHSKTQSGIEVWLTQ